LSGGKFKSGDGRKLSQETLGSFKTCVLKSYEPFL
jgi:hypothetical protein